MIGFAANVFSVIVSQYGICARCYHWFAVRRKFQMFEVWWFRFQVFARRSGSEIHPALCLSLSP